MIFAQFGQAFDINTVVTALTTCVADPVACRPTFSKVMVDLTPSTLTADRRVLELIGQAFARGPAGPNPFLETSFAPDVIRIHADADPDLAAELLLQGIDLLLNEGTLARANAGPDGFLSHAVDGLDARVAIRVTPPPSADLRARIVAALQRVAAATDLTDPSQRAAKILTDLGEPIAAPQPASDTTAPFVSATTDDQTRRQKTFAVAVGLGLAVGTAAIGLLAAGLSAPRAAPALARRRRR